DELIRLYQGARLYVLPSLYEGSWLTAAEALACGCPTIVSNTSALVEIVPAGARFDPLDPAAVAAAIAGALDGPPNPCATAAEAAVGQPRPTWDAVAARTAAAYAAVRAAPF